MGPWNAIFASHSSRIPECRTPSRDGSPRIPESHVKTKAHSIDALFGGSRSTFANLRRPVHFLHEKSYQCDWAGGVCTAGAGWDQRGAEVGDYDGRSAAKWNAATGSYAGGDD